jgi:bacterioferritin
MPHFVKDVEEIRERARQKIEDGAVTSTYGLDKNKAVEILNEALATEIVCVLRYMHHYFMATGVHGSAARDEFKEHADEEREHADRIAERIQQLGGKPDYNPKGLLERSVSHYVEGETLADMIREDLVAERVVIDVYREMIKYFGDKDPTTRVLIEDVLEEEEEHASDLSDLLFVVNPSTGETAEQDPGTEIGESHREEQMDRGQSRSGNGSSRTKAFQEERSRAKAQAEDDAEEAREALSSADRSKQSTPVTPARTMRGNEASNAARGDRNERRGGRAPELSNPSFAGTSQRGTSQERPASGRKEAQPAHAPGTTGRVMARRGRNDVEPAKDDIALAGQSGSSRSPKVINKNRKSRAA